MNNLFYFGLNFNRLFISGIWLLFDRCQKLKTMKTT